MNSGLAHFLTGDVQAGHETMHVANSCIIDKLLQQMCLQAWNGKLIGKQINYHEYRVKPRLTDTPQQRTPTI